MRRYRVVAATLVALAVLLAACSGNGSDATPSVEASPVPPGSEQAPAEDAAASPSAAAPGEPDVSEGSGDAAQPPQDEAEASDGAGGDTGQQSTLAPLQDGGPVGANAAAYLRGDRARVVLEIDLQDGASLPDGVMAHVREVLARESNASVEVQTGDATATRRDAWTADQLRAAAGETRSVAHGDDTRGAPPAGAARPLRGRQRARPRVRLVERGGVPRPVVGPDHRPAVRRPDRTRRHDP